MVADIDRVVNTTSREKACRYGNGTAAEIGGLGDVGFAAIRALGMGAPNRTAITTGVIGITVIDCVWGSGAVTKREGT